MVPAALLQVKSPQYPLDRKVGGHHSQSGDSKERYIQLCQESDDSFEGHPAYILVTVVTELPGGV